MSIKCQFIVDMYLCFLAYSKEESLSAIRGRSEEDFEVLFNSPLHSNPARRKETSLPLDSLSSWIAAKVSSTVDLFLVPPLSIFQLLFFQGFMINHWCKVLTSLSLSPPLYLHTVPSYIKKILLKEYKEKVPGARNQPGEIISYLTWSKCRSLSIFRGIKLRNRKCTDPTGGTVSGVG